MIWRRVLAIIPIMLIVSFLVFLLSAFLPGDAAVTLAEGVYLLKIQRPFTPPGDNNNSEGPEPLEASPAQIKAKLEKDPVLWNAKIEALRNVALEVLEIVKSRKTDELWQAGDDLDQACESCHVQYWYPGDPALLDKIDRGLKQLNENSARKQ